jgi:hypothetical protein
MMDSIGAIHIRKIPHGSKCIIPMVPGIQGCHPGMVFEKVSPHLPHQEAYGKMPQSNTVRLNGSRTALRSNQTDRDMKHTIHSAYQGHGDGNTSSGDIGIIGNLSRGYGNIRSSPSCTFRRIRQLRRTSTEDEVCVVRSWATSSDVFLELVPESRHEALKGHERNP